MLDRGKKNSSRPKNLRDKLRNQEIIIEALISEISNSEEEFKLFKFIVENKKISFSRNYSDLVALFYLGKNRKFLEIGAGEPIIGSDTYLLEQKNFWTGIQIEPDLESFEKLKKLRTNSICINAAIVGDTDSKRYFLNPTTMRLSTKQKNFAEVKTINMNSIKDANGKFDALFVDIEGNELSVISSKFFMEFNFKFINIEMIWNNSEIFEILTGYGYKQVGANFSSYSGWFISGF
jgi:FkbM family methyltransferase